MSVTESQLTTPTCTLKVPNGITYAFRRYGNRGSGAPPLLMLQHFRGNLENWDPAFVDALAQSREVILLDNTGVGRSTGRTPRDVTSMAHDALAFADTLELREIDVLGFSLGGFVAQELALIRPQIARRLVLAASGPRSGIGYHPIEARTHATMMKDRLGAEDLLSIFFLPSESSIAKGWEFLQRAMAREEDRDADVMRATFSAQMDAITEYGIPDPVRLARLAGIRQPVLVANGVEDAIFPTPNTHLLHHYLPNAEIEIYPDAGHAFLFQYAEQFAERVTAFLDAD
jgi:pimeloyl-ACP methyl ester carboxylesterase